MQQDDFYNILTDDPPKSVNVNGVNSVSYTHLTLPTTSRV